MKNLSVELQEQLQNDFKSESHPHVERVYFSNEPNRYYFHQHSCFAKRGDTEKKFYGSADRSYQQLLPGSDPIDNIKERVPLGDPKTLITSSMSIQEILDFEIEKPNETTLADQIKNLSKEDKLIIKAILSEENLAEETQPNKKIKASEL